MTILNLALAACPTIADTVTRSLPDFSYLSHNRRSQAAWLTTNTE
jgi:hypothetical protein